MFLEACAIEADNLGWLLRAGRVAGQKRRGPWHTSEEAVRRYQHEVDARDPDRPPQKALGTARGLPGAHAIFCLGQLDGRDTARYNVIYWHTAAGALQVVMHPKNYTKWNVSLSSAWGRQA